MNKEVDVNSFGFIRKKLLETVSLLSKIDLVDEYEKIKRSNEDYVEKYFTKTGFPALSQPLETSDCEKTTIMLATTTTMRMLTTMKAMIVKCLWLTHTLELILVSKSCMFMTIALN